MNTIPCDFIVIGSGIAGLRAAIDLSKAGSVKVFCKGDAWQSSTRWAQGGIAAAMQEGDTVDFHLQDTLNAGDGLCFEPAVRTLVEEGPARIEELVKFGAQFDQVEGRFIFGREGAHSRNRILHAGDATGWEIVRALLNWVEQTPQIEILPHKPAVDLILEGNRCTGIITLDESTGTQTAYTGRAVLLASGGAGQIFSHTTNPEVATGDGVAMAYRAGADLMDLEFFQFHPTAFHFSGAPRFLMTEALRGEGAVLRNTDGKTFMQQYHSMADLAPRDIVSRSIANEMKKAASSWVFLDATSIPRKKLRSRFPNIYQFLQSYDLNLSVDWIPVSPSAHYWMGGVMTDLYGRTSATGLYAAGEVACNGVHGANRLASNSLLEGLVFGARAGDAILNDPHPKRSQKETPDPAIIPSSLTDVFSLAELKKMNWHHLGLIRSEEGIRRVLAFFDTLPNVLPSTLQNLELRNLLDCSKLMGSFALLRTESRGSHFRQDFPDRNPAWTGHHTVLRKGKIELLEIA